MRLILSSALFEKFKFISFSVFRSKIKGWFEKKFVKPNSQVKKIVKVIDKMKMSSLALLVAIPFTPAFAINIAAGLSNIPKRKFIYAILIGKMFMVYFWGYIGTTEVICDNTTVTFENVSPW